MNRAIEEQVRAASEKFRQRTFGEKRAGMDFTFK
jgi:hypothetical protein